MLGLCRLCSRADTSPICEVASQTNANFATPLSFERQSGLPQDRGVRAHDFEEQIHVGHVDNAIRQSGLRMFCRYQKSTASQTIISLPGL